jgi:hypothetical protein
VFVNNDLGRIGKEAVVDPRGLFLDGLRKPTINSESIAVLTVDM